MLVCTFIIAGKIFQQIFLSTSGRIVMSTKTAHWDWVGEIVICAEKIVPVDSVCVSFVVPLAVEMR